MDKDRELRVLRRMAVEMKEELDELRPKKEEYERYRAWYPEGRHVRRSPAATFEKMRKLRSRARWHIWRLRVTIARLRGVEPDEIEETVRYEHQWLGPVKGGHYV